MRLIVIAIFWSLSFSSFGNQKYTTTYYQSSGNEHIVDVLHKKFGMNSTYLKKNGRGLITDLKRWNPHIKNWGKISKGQKIYLELPSRYVTKMPSQSKARYRRLPTSVGKKKVARRRPQSVRQVVKAKKPIQVDGMVKRRPSRRAKIKGKSPTYAVGTKKYSDDTMLYLEVPLKDIIEYSMKKREGTILAKQISEERKRAKEMEWEDQWEDERKKRFPANSRVNYFAREVPMEHRNYFFDLAMYAQKASYDDETTAGGSTLSSEKGNLEIGILFAKRWKPENKHFYYFESSFVHSGSVTVGTSNDSFSTPNALNLGGGILLPEFWKEFTFLFGLRREQVSYLSFNKTNTITSSNASTLLTGTTGTFYSLKAKAIYAFRFFKRPTEFNAELGRSIIGSLELENDSYAPSASILDITAGLKHFVYKDFWLEATYKYGFLSADSISTTESILSINIGHLFMD